MKNDFEAVMSKCSDNELVIIISTDRHKYQQSAIEAAEIEIEKRKINPSIIAEFKKTAEFQKAINDLLSTKKSNLKKRAINQIVDYLAIVVLIKTLIFFMSIIIKSTQDLEVLLFVLVYFLYYFYMENKYQQTLGKFLTKTKVVNLNGAKPSVKQLIGRAILRTIPYVFISFFTDENGLHDSLTNTRVIDI
jgi:uncharacterized RDD family membrane protein YckC